MFATLIKRLFLILSIFTVFGLVSTPLNALAGQTIPDQIQLEYMNTQSKEIVQSGLENALKKLLAQKVNQENSGDTKFEVTHTQLLENSLIISLSNLTPEEIIHADKNSGQPAVARKINFFNIIFLKTQNGWQGVLDNQLSSEKIASTPNLGLAEKSSLEGVKKITLNAASTNKYRDYKFPWPAGEAWVTEITYNNSPWGWHTDHVGWALDFLPPANASLNILASSPGVVEWICTTDNSRNQAGVHIRTVAGGVDYGETLRYYHIRKDMLAVGYQSVEQGQYLGKLKEGGNTGYPGCNLYSYNTHLHLGFPARDFQIDGIVFNPALSMQWSPLYSSQGYIRNKKVVFHDSSEGPLPEKNQTSSLSSLNTETQTFSSQNYSRSTESVVFSPVLVSSSSQTQNSQSVSSSSSEKTNSLDFSSSELSTNNFSTKKDSKNSDLILAMVFFPPISILSWLTLNKIKETKKS
jgi:hypothetical protein